MPDQKNLILIPTDFSEACDNAIDHGVEIAKAYKAEVCILHIINKDTKAYLQKNNLTEEDLDKRLEVIANGIINTHKIAVSVDIRYGSIFNEINKTAKDISADLMVLGTQGKTGFQKLIGGFAMRIILQSPIPVIVVQKRSLNEGYKNIIFPVNESIEYEKKISWVEKLHFAFQSKVHIFKFKESNPEYLKSINEVTENICSALDDKGIEYFEAEAKQESNFSKQLLEYAVSTSADLIMIMTNNDEFEPSFILGSPEEKMIYNTSQIPVLCINPDK